jgi:hypothetical protein
LVKDLVELFVLFKVDEKQVVEKIQPLLKDENRYIATQALKYLESLDNPDKKTERTIEKYRRKYNL